MRSGRSIAALVLLMALCLGVAAVGAWATSHSVTTWYPTLRKPAWNPPAWLFGPVWTVLYLMMATAAWMIWRTAGPSRARLLTIFAVQLALNAAWSPLFFGLRSPGAGLLDIAALWVAVAATLISFWRVAPLTGLLLVPYWLWVTFAAALNLSIWKMNR
jgi:translocator protein